MVVTLPTSLSAGHSPELVPQLLFFKDRPWTVTSYFEFCTLLRAHVCKRLMTCVVWLLFLEEIQVRVFVTATIFSAGLDIEILANSLCGWWLNFVSHLKNLPHCLWWLSHWCKPKSGLDCSAVLGWICCWLMETTLCFISSVLSVRQVLFVKLKSVSNKSFGQIWVYVHTLHVCLCVCAALS